MHAAKVPTLHQHYHISQRFHFHIISQWISSRTVGSLETRDDSTPRMKCINRRKRKKKKQCGTRTRTHNQIILKFVLIDYSAPVYFHLLNFHSSHELAAAIATVTIAVADVS